MTSALRNLSAAVCLSLLASGVAIAPATAAEPESAAEALSDRLDQVSNALLADQFSAEPGKAVVADVENVTVEIPAVATSAIDIETPTGGSISIGLPDVGPLEPATVADDGTVVYETDGNVSIGAQALADGGVRALLVIETSDAPVEYRFDIGVPAGGYLELQPDGAVNVADGAGLPAGHFEAPWAFDSAGLPVPTSYRIEGTTIVQVVEHSSNYPVVADPNYTWGWVTGTVYYTRAETRSMKTWSYGAVVAAGLCAAFAVQTAMAACAISAAFYAQWNYVAGNAYGDGKCMKIKVPTFWASAYTEGTCR
jgi:hypothetical protein